MGREQSSAWRVVLAPHRYAAPVPEGFGYRVTTRVASRYQLLLVPENLDNSFFGLPGRSLVKHRTRFIQAA